MTFPLLGAKVVLANVWLLALLALPLTSKVPPARVRTEELLTRLLLAPMLVKSSSKVPLVMTVPPV